MKKVQINGNNIVKEVDERLHPPLYILFYLVKE